MCSMKVDEERQLVISLIRSCRQVSHVEELHASLLPTAKHTTLITNLLIHAYARCGSISRAVHLFQTTSPDRRNLFSWNIMLSAYAQAGHMDDAEQLFERMTERNLVSWNTMINAYAQHERVERVILLYRQFLAEGLTPDKVTFVAVLQSATEVSQARLVHAHVVLRGLESNLLVATALVTMYGRCGSVELAQECFARATHPDVVLSNALITALFRNGKLEDAERMFHQLSNKDVATFTAMVTGYAHNGHMEQARLTFESSPWKNVVSWNAMITAYADKGEFAEALELFERMKFSGVKPNRVTCLTMLEVCGSLRDPEQGKAVDELAVKTGISSDIIYSNALLNMYGRCGDLEAAECVYSMMSLRNVVSWNSMLAAYTRNGQALQAIQLFREMDVEGIGVTSVTLSTFFDACGDSESLLQGTLVHQDLVGTEFLREPPVCNSLITMYGQCSRLDDAERTFGAMVTKSVISWTGMITAYAHNGHSAKTVQVLESMSLEGMEPNQVTFVSILSACSHAGLSEQGLTCFVSMIQDYGLVPLAEHYICVVDMLARAGEVKEANRFIGQMPFQPHPVAWTSLLGACKVQNATDLGNAAADEFRSLEPEKDAPYVMQSNLLS